MIKLRFLKLLKSINKMFKQKDILVRFLEIYHIKKLRFHLYNFTAYFLTVTFLLKVSSQLTVFIAITTGFIAIFRFLIIYNYGKKEIQKMVVFEKRIFNTVALFLFKILILNSYSISYLAILLAVVPLHTLIFDLLVKR